MNTSPFATGAALHQRRTNRAIEHLMGMITGVVADAALCDREILLLRTWLTQYPEAIEVFPGSIVARKVHAVLEDGVITEDERAHLLETLTSLVGAEFSLTGSASPEVASLPIEDAVTVDLADSVVCLTGEFLFGTRAACERLVLKTGAMCTDTVSKKVDILVVGTKVSPNWAHTSFGRKIQQAVALQEKGHPIEIISEKRLMAALE